VGRIRHRQRQSQSANLIQNTLKDLENWNNIIEKVAEDAGLDYYPQEFEIVNYNEMIGYESYVGMPSRYPHWSFGKTYEKLKTLYRFNLTGLHMNGN